jgi:hypothetical protein
VSRTIRYPDGTVRHVYAGPEARPWWRRHLGSLACVALLAVAILLAHYGGH